VRAFQAHRQWFHCTTISWLTPVSDNPHYQHVRKQRPSVFSDVSKHYHNDQIHFLYEWSIVRWTCLLDSAGWHWQSADWHYRLCLQCTTTTAPIDFLTLVCAKLNYPSLVTSYDTRPGNELGLFYNAPEPTQGNNMSSVSTEFTDLYVNNISGRLDKKTRNLCGVSLCRITWENVVTRRSKRHKIRGKGTRALNSIVPNSGRLYSTTNTIYQYNPES